MKDETEFIVQIVRVCAEHNYCTGMCGHKSHVQALTQETDLNGMFIDSVIEKSNDYNKFSKLRQPTVMHAWQRGWSNWRTDAKTTVISGTLTTATDMRATRSSSNRIKADPQTIEPQKCHPFNYAKQC